MGCLCMAAIKPEQRKLSPARPRDRQAAPPAQTTSLQPQPTPAMEFAERALTSSFLSSADMSAVLLSFQAQSSKSQKVSRGFQRTRI
jgi:hypothetical protein